MDFKKVMRLIRNNVSRAHRLFALSMIVTPGLMYSQALTMEGQSGAFFQPWEPREIKYVPGASAPSDVIYAVRISRLPNSPWSIDVGTGHVGTSIASGINFKTNDAVLSGPISVFDRTAN